LNIIIKYITSYNEDKERDMGIGFHERGGLKGLLIFIIFYSSLLELFWKGGYMSFLGRPHGS
jgi:hypothetical protein